MADTYKYQDGQFVSQRVAQVVEAIREYSPELEVQWIPRGARTDNQAAFKIIHHPSDGASYTVFHVASEEEFDTRVLKRIIEGDQRRGDITYSEFEAAEKAAELVAKQRYLDEMEEARELSAAILRSPKNTYKVSKDLVISDYKRGNQASKPKHL